MHQKEKIKAAVGRRISEIQIGSITQDLWATLSHREIYKEIELPYELKNKMFNLGDILDKTDTQAEGIMDEIEKEKQKSYQEKWWDPRLPVCIPNHCDSNHNITQP